MKAIPEVSLPACAGRHEEGKIMLSPNALRVLEKRYLVRDEEGRLTETPEQLFRRVALTIAAADRLYGSDETQVVETATRFEALMKSLRFLPNTPTLMNAGKPYAHPQYSACFVVPVEDDMRSIGNAVTAAMMIHKTGGGTGFSFSRLRPKGDLVRSSGGVASGPVSFMRIFDAATEQVKQGSTRRGANMGILQVDHPDILEFIACKAHDAQIKNFNISVAITDAFMKALERDEAYPLINPRTQQVVKTLPARQVWDLIVQHAWSNGDPGLFFIDRANGACPIQHAGTIESTNPCVTGDTLIYTDRGLMRADVLAFCEEELCLPVDSRFNLLEWAGASSVSTKGVKPVFRLVTEEGYEVRLTADHQVMTNQGWKRADALQAGDLLWILNRKGGFGTSSDTAAEGRILGWLIAEGFICPERGAVLDFRGDNLELAPVFAGYLNEMTGGDDPRYQNMRVDSKLRDHFRLRSMRLGLKLEKWYGLTVHHNFHSIPPEVFFRSEDFQRGVLQALFTAKGHVSGTTEQEVHIRLNSMSLPLLKDVQRVLLNFGIASCIYPDRGHARIENFPEAIGEIADDEYRPNHVLVISQDNLDRFAKEIGFLLKTKQDWLLVQLGSDRYGPYKENFLVRFKALIPDGFELVYDLHEPLTHSFVANGLVVHNCGEIPLHPWDACNLASVNLEQHLVRDPETGTSDIDWPKLRETVHTAVHFLDNVIDANDHPLTEINEMTRKTRRIGLGIMGLARMLFALGVPYDSQEGLRVAEKIMCFIQEEGWKASEALAEVRGVYPAWKGSRHESDGRRVRNSYVTAIAPTGTISMIADTSGGCEPEFSLVWYKHVLDGENLPYICDPFVQVAKREGWWDEKLIEKILANGGSCRGLKEVPEKWQQVFATAHDIAPAWHVRMQAVLQLFTDAAVSKTINLPRGASIEDVGQVYRMSYKLGCKGITVYRDGSRAGQVLNVGMATSGKEKEKASSLEPATGNVQRGVLEELPDIVEERRVRVRTQDGNAYIHVGFIDGKAKELFAHPALGRYQGFVALACRLASTILRLGGTMEQVLEQFYKAHREYGDVSTPILALMKGIQQVMAHAGQPVVVTDKCPECSQTMRMQEGCMGCGACGFSRC